ncbi:hypothetical protein NDU88_008860 [Pleurodeles waltl]|uniref:Uncharacterized protein n=1 Tax=Pleurodeles waltl TaxID=8319 RepID=A0AAV7QPX2_PLEWA|nr:hypothetical protein NDU88_008860 [Pleurodeles waltl]
MLRTRWPSSASQALPQGRSHFSSPLSPCSELRHRATGSAYFTAHFTLCLPGLHCAPPAARLPDRQAPDTAHCHPRLESLVTCSRPQALSARKPPGVQALRVRGPSLHQCLLTHRHLPLHAAHLWLPESTGQASSFRSPPLRWALSHQLLLCLFLRRITPRGSAPPDSHRRARKQPPTPAQGVPATPPCSLPPSVPSG